MSAVQRPQPIAEIVVDGVDDVKRVIRLTAVTTDAAMWLLREVSRYGKAHVVGDAAYQYFVEVSPAYKLLDVLAWLEHGYTAQSDAAQDAK